jgi:hypothetical protein
LNVEHTVAKPPTKIFSSPAASHYKGNIMMKPIDIEMLLNQTFFGLDTLAMLSDIEDFIELSEKNIDEQKQQELQVAERKYAEEQFEDPHLADQYYDQMIEGIAYRFDVSLTQRVRYAALTSIITTIEWALVALKNRATFEIPPKPGRKCDVVHLLEVFNSKASAGLTSEIQNIEVLVQVRNCIVHAAGILSSYKHGAGLRQSISLLDGIKVSNLNLLGDAIEIERGHLQNVVEDVKCWLPRLEEAMNNTSKTIPLSPHST